MNPGVNVASVQDPQGTSVRGSSSFTYQLYVGHWTWYREHISHSLQSSSWLFCQFNKSCLDQNAASHLIQTHTYTHTLNKLWGFSSQITQHGLYRANPHTEWVRFSCLMGKLQWLLLNGGEEGRKRKVWKTNYRFVCVSSSKWTLVRVRRARRNHQFCNNLQPFQANEIQEFTARQIGATCLWLAGRCSCK